MAPLPRRWLSVAPATVLSIPLVTAAAEPGPAESLTAQENGPEALRSSARAPESYQVLVLTKTDGTRRASIQDGVRVIRALGQANGFTVTVTQDGGAFTAENLANYRVVAFLRGVTVANTSDTGGGQHVTGIDVGDYIAFDPVNLGGAGAVTFRYSGGSAATAGTPRATVELRVGSPTGTVVATATLNATSGNNSWASQSVPVSHPAGTQRLYLVFGAVPGGPTTGLINLNWVEFGTATP